MPFGFFKKARETTEKIQELGNVIRRIDVNVIKRRGNSTIVDKYNGFIIEKPDTKGVTLYVPAYDQEVPIRLSDLHIRRVTKEKGLIRKKQIIQELVEYTLYETDDGRLVKPKIDEKEKKVTYDDDELWRRQYFAQLNWGRDKYSEEKKESLFDLLKQLSPYIMLMLAFIVVAYMGFKFYEKQGKHIEEMYKTEAQKISEVATILDRITTKLDLISSRLAMIEKQSAQAGGGG